MKCRYREKTIISGNRREVFYYPEYAAASGKRKPRFKKSSEIQARLNERNAIRKLSRLLNCNFTEDDYMITLEYADFFRPGSLDAVKGDLTNYVRRLKRYCTKLGGENFRYIAVFEEGGKNGNYHIHIFVAADGARLDRDTLEKIWGRGCANTKRLQPEYFDGLDRIGSYVQKDPKGGRRWIGSKNLKKPIEPPPRTVSRKLARAVLEAAEEKDAPPPFPGFHIVKKTEINNEVNGGLYGVIDLIAERRETTKCRKRE